MSTSRQIPPLIWRLMRRLNQRLALLIGKGGGPAGVVLVLTTTGRKSGLPRQTPLQYEEIDGAYYIGSARGQEADWFLNILADPHVTLQVKGKRFAGLAEAITDARRIADFLELRLQRHPRMIRMIMRADGLPARHTRSDLERFATGKAMVAIRPV